MKLSIIFALLLAGCGRIPEPPKPSGLPPIEVQAECWPSTDKMEIGCYTDDGGMYFIKVVVPDGRIANLCISNGRLFPSRGNGICYEKDAPR